MQACVTLPNRLASSSSLSFGFLPVEILDAEPAGPLPDAGTQIEVELSNGHRLKVQGGFDPDALAVLIRKLAS